MKRLLSLAVFIFCVLVASSKIIGDVNGDEKISAADVATLGSYLIDDNIQYDSRLADVDENGIVDNGDVVALVEIILGLREAKQLVEDDVDALIIKYTDEGATYQLPEAWIPYVTVTVNGTDVTVTNTNATEEYVTVLSGSCTDGSFIYNGSFNINLHEKNTPKKPFS